MTHTGKIWLVGDETSAAMAGSVAFDDDDVTLRVNDVVLGTWTAVLINETGEARFELHAGANDLVFQPDDYVGFASEVEGRAFKQRLVSTQEPVTDLVSVPVQETLGESVPSHVPAKVDQNTVVKSAGLAAVLSAIWSGLGQIYNGEVGKGVAIMVIQVVNFILAFVLIGFLTGFAVWVWAIYDAYTVAETRILESTT